MSLLFAGLPHLSPLFGGEDPLAPVGRARWHHFDITFAAAIRAGFAPDAAYDVAWHATAVDFYLYHPLWCAAGGRRRLVGAAMARPTLHSVHFDDLTSTMAVAALRARITAGAAVGLRWACARRDPDAARHLIGVGLHGIQDFYSHSTWIDDPRRRHLTWTEAGDAVSGMQVQTGVYAHPGGGRPHHGRIAITPAVLARLPAWLLDAATGRDISEAAGEALDPGQPFPDDLGTPARDVPAGVRVTGPAGINLDSTWQAHAGVRRRGVRDLDGAQAFHIARTLALRDSGTWLLELGGRVRAVDPAFWAAVRGSATTDRATARDGVGGRVRRRRQFEDPLQRPYQFIATDGDHPRDGRPDDWWLRIAVAGARHDRVAVEAAGRRATVRLRRRGAFGAGTGGVVVLGPYSRLPAELSVRCRRALSVDVEAITSSRPTRHVTLADVAAHRAGTIPLPPDG